MTAANIIKARIEKSSSCLWNFATVLAFIKSDRSQVGFGFVFTVFDSDSQFRIGKSNSKLENLKAIFCCFKEN